MRPDLLRVFSRAHGTDRPARLGSVLRRNGNDMLRGWWCMEMVLLCFLVEAGRRIGTGAAAAADCWYENRRYKESSNVVTSEPCLNCTCKKGTLLCYLRVCPELPDPPPPGCVLVHKYRSCCPRLICSDASPRDNELQSRSDPDDLPTFFEDPSLRQACEHNGSIFEPGSAMTSSTFCEHCFCIGGKQRCVRPRCLLEIKGCSPVYEDYSCCPVRYNCTEARRMEISATSSTAKYHKKKNSIREGCFVMDKYYPEGSKVLGVGYSACDNCYCVRGIVRCEPMSCAPPLLGCTPVIKEGQCCATSYNCNNTIEIQPNPNYGEFPEISKEYAKLRKEVPNMEEQKVNKNYKENGLHYVIAHSFPSRDFDNIYYKTPQHFSSISYKKVNQHVTYKRHTSPSAVARYPNVSTNLRRAEPAEETLTPTKEETTEKNKPTASTVLNTSSTTSLEEEVLNATDKTSNTIDAQNDERKNNKETTIPELSTATVPITTTSIDENTETVNNTELYTASTLPTTVVSKTECLQTDSTSTRFEPDTENDISYDERSTMQQEPTTTQEERSKLTTLTLHTTTGTDAYEPDSELKANDSTSAFVRLPAAPAVLANILNDSVMEEDATDYDYNEPTLPPSLPNLRIIPFVAADAVDQPNEEDTKHYPQVTVAPPYTLFSPPTKTEGGFVPKEPPLLPEFYENNFHPATTDRVSEKVNSIPSITESSNTIDYSCKTEDDLVEHGQTVPGTNSCTICTCFYGNIVCHEPICPPPEIYCKQLPERDTFTCCPRHYCGEDAATSLPIDRMDDTGALFVANVSKAVDPPNVTRRPTVLPAGGDFDPLSTATLGQPSLVALDRKRLTNEINETALDANQKNKPGGPATDTVQWVQDNGAITTTTKSSVIPNEEKANYLDSAVGALKLAGCNIYGRMYRVGKIILELSGPCLECRCTEVGVQCKSNKC